MDTVMKPVQNGRGRRQQWISEQKLTVDTYGKWLPMESQAAVDRLDSPLSESGSKPGGRLS